MQLREDNVINETNLLIELLTDAKTSYEKEEYEGLNPLFGDTMNIRLLVHLLGDIHQPLHGCERYTNELPDGDRGGNDFKIKFQEDITNLHSLYDSGLGMYKMNFTMPMDDESWEYCSSIALDIMAEHPRSSFTDIETPVEWWAEEEYLLCKEFVYKFIDEDEYPSDFYMEVGEALVDRRIAKGGYRLAWLFLNMWSEVEIAEE